MASDPVPDPMPYLDPQDAALVAQTGKLLNGRDLTKLSIAEARKFFDDIQKPAPMNPGVTVKTFMVETSHGDVKTFLYRPKHASADDFLPFVLHLHGGGWFLGNAFDDQALVFDLVERTGFAVVLPEYRLAPEERFPVQQEQCIEMLEFLVKHGNSKGLSTDRVVVSGDSAGGQLVAAVSILNHQRSLHLPITHQILLHPLLDATSLSSTFSQFIFQDGPVVASGLIAEGIDDYFGLDNIKDRSSITASPILMIPKQAKEYMPSTTIITAHADWLRDQGQNFAKLLQTAGVECGVLQAVACVHDCEVFNVSRTSPTVELIMLAVAGRLREVLAPRNGEADITAGLVKAKKRRRGSLAVC